MPIVVNGLGGVHTLTRILSWKKVITRNQERRTKGWHAPGLKTVRAVAQKLLPLSYSFTIESGLL